MSKIYEQTVDENTISYTYEKMLKNTQHKLQDFPGGPVVKNLPTHAGDMGSIASPGRIPCAAKRLSPCATTTEPMF